MKKQLKIKDHLVSKEDFLVLEHLPGVLKTQPHITDKELAKYYESAQYISHSSGTGLFDGVYAFFSRLMLSKKFNLIKKHLDKDSVVLDFGCGKGAFVSFLSNKGYDSIGIENNKNAIKQCVENNIKTKPSIKEIATGFKAICFWHSFEHLSNYKQILSSISELIDDHGTVLIALPNYESFDAKYYGSFWAAYDVPRHRFHFSSAGLINTMSDAGFTFIKKHPLLLDAFYVSMLSEKYKNNKLYFLFGFVVGLISNCLGLLSSNFSSSTYIFKKSN